MFSRYVASEISEDILSLLLDENLPISYRYHLFNLFKGVCENVKR